MSYSIVARCPRTGQVGVAIASFTISIGLCCDGAARSNVGATLTQGAPNPRNNRLALNLVAQGFNARLALKELLASDTAADYRLIGIVDREGNTAVHCGKQVPAASTHYTGREFVVLGDGLANRGVVDAMASRFEATAGEDLDERLLKALESGRDAGGLAGEKGRLPERSVALVVFGKRDFSDVDLRVDLHDKAVDELRRVYVDYKPHAAYYLQRAQSPRNAIPAMEFADMLKNGQVPEKTS